MLEIIVDKNISGQRLDRFVRKYLDRASLGFIYGQIRKKNIVVNNKRAKETYILREDDRIRFYLADDTIKKFKSRPEVIRSEVDLDIVYEDENILLINKKAGVLSHSNGQTKGVNNIVDGLVSYLIEKKDFDPGSNPTFRPGIANRLDRNTSGLIIGVKNYRSLREINRAQRRSSIKKYYESLVFGRLDKERELVGSLVKNEEENKVYQNEGKGSKGIRTRIKPIIIGDNLTLLEIDLITGRTHQIRFHLQTIGHPIVGDRKYGHRQKNIYFTEKYKLRSQLLHCHKIRFEGLEGELDYLNGRSFAAARPEIFQRIIEGELYGENSI